jgi:hypothetical protein
MDRLTTRKTLLLAAGASVLAYVFMPSCYFFVPDEDDTLCHALAAAEDGKVEWPSNEAEYWLVSDRSGESICQVFDHVWMSPWWFDQAARDYIEGFGLAQGHHWDELGRAAVTAYDEDTGFVNTPLGRTYNAYANIIYSNPEGIDLERGRPLDDFAYYDTFLKWASAFVYQKTFRVSGTCERRCATSGSCTIARTASGPFRNDFIELYQSFFYDIDAIWRAASIVHEVRHARDGVHHLGGDACPRRSSCDPRWSSGGANAYELMWLAAYFTTSKHHPFAGGARSARAEALFDSLRYLAFVDPVRWNKESLMMINEAPEYYLREAACSEDPARPHPCLILAN